MRFLKTVIFDLNFGVYLYQISNFYRFFTGINYKCHAQYQVPVPTVPVGKNFRSGAKAVLKLRGFFNVCRVRLVILK
jgi:hypothetical protein